jgi:hypothetical protein
MSSLLVFHKVYRLEIQSVMFVFSIQLCDSQSWVENWVTNCELLPL